MSTVDSPSNVFGLSPTFFSIPPSLADKTTPNRTRLKIVKKVNWVSERDRERERELLSNRIYFGTMPFMMIIDEERLKPPLIDWAHERWWWVQPMRSHTLSKPSSPSTPLHDPHLTLTIWGFVFFLLVFFSLL